MSLLFRTHRSIISKYANAISHPSHYNSKSSLLLQLCCRCVQTNVSNTDSSFPVHSVKVKTSVERWEEFPFGLEFDVSYVDTRPLVGYQAKKAPTVLLSHGVPGTHNSFYSLPHLLHNKGYRVIIPNYPACGLTKAADKEQANCFLHSPSEKAEFLLDLLDKIEVDCVDVGVGHSLGTAPLLTLASQTNRIASAVHVAPSAHIPNKKQQPYWVLKAVSRGWDSRNLRPLLSLMLWASFPILGLKGKDSEQRIALTRAAANADYDSVGGDVLSVLEKGFPLSFMLPDKDTYADVPLYSAFMDLFDIKDIGNLSESTFKSVLQAEQEVAKVQAWWLQECGHFMFGGKHSWTSEAVAQEVDRLLQLVRS